MVTFTRMQTVKARILKGSQWKYICGLYLELNLMTIYFIAYSSY